MGIPARSRGEVQAKAARSFMARRVVLPAQAYIHTAGLSGFVLVAAAAVAIAWANSPFGESYFEFQHIPIALGWGTATVEMSLQHWVNDLLMAVFFFVVGLEIKRELVEGELSDTRRATLPVIAALGGMVVPAAIYAALNYGGPGSRGWGIPMATDIAFALGVLALLGDRIPGQVRVLLLALAIVDDIGAILVIAVFYTQGVSWAALAVAVGLLGLIVVMQRAGFVGFPMYFVVGLLVWVATYQSGVHATLAGVALGMITPTRPKFGRQSFDESARGLLASYEAALAADDLDQADAILGQFEELCVGTESALDRLERVLHPWSSYVVLPIFALVNAGVRLDGAMFEAALGSRVTLGIVLGLIVGKFVGILGFTWLSTRLGLTDLPRGATFPQVGGMALIAGIGFTVSLFITELAFLEENVRAIGEAKVGILGASLLAGALGFVYLRFFARSAAVPPAEDGVDRSPIVEM